MSATAVAASPLSLHDRFKSALTHRYFIRLHMTILLALVFLSGLLASRLMTGAGIRNMALRYPIAVALSYLVFFGLVRIWIAYVGRASRSRRRGTESGGGDLGDIFSGSGGSGGSGGGGGGRFLSGGGRFGGGGSSATFADDASPRMVAVPLPSPAPAPKSAGGGGSRSGFSFDLDGDGVVLLILFALLVIGICGVGAYLVYQGPAILSEAAFHAALVPGLVRTARNSHDPGWVPGVFRATVIPFLIVLALAALFGYQAHKRCPQAATVRQVFTGCIFR